MDTQGMLQQMGRPGSRGSRQPKGMGQPKDTMDMGQPIHKPGKHQDLGTVRQTGKPGKRPGLGTVLPKGTSGTVQQTSTLGKHRDLGTELPKGTSGTVQQTSTPGRRPGLGTELPRGTKDKRVPSCMADMRTSLFPVWTDLQKRAPWPWKWPSLRRTEPVPSPHVDEHADPTAAQSHSQRTIKMMATIPSKAVVTIHTLKRPRCEDAR
jgi:hypothetical protein